jgi:hypothetical protein
MPVRAVVPQVMWKGFSQKHERRTFLQVRLRVSAGRLRLLRRAPAAELARGDDQAGAEEDEAAGFRGLSRRVPAPVPRGRRSQGATGLMVLVFSCEVA